MEEELKRSSWPWGWETRTGCVPSMEPSAPGCRGQLWMSGWECGWPLGGGEQTLACRGVAVGEKVECRQTWVS